MPRIQRIQPSGNTITPDVPTQHTNIAGGGGRELEVIGSGISDSYQKIANANLLVEKTRAENHFEQKINDIRARATQETDITPEKRKLYDDEIKTATTEAASFIKIPAEKSIFSMDAESKAHVARIAINTDFNKKIIAQGQAEMDVYLKTKENDFISAPNLKMKETAIMERNKKISDMVAAGFLDKSEATKKLAELDTKWNKAQVDYDILTNPIMAKQLLEAKDYPGIDELDRAKYIKDAQEAIDKNELEAKKQLFESRQNVENDLIWKKIKGELTVNDVMGAKDLISPRLADSLIKQLKSPNTIKAVTNLFVYEDIMQDIMKRDKPASEVRQKIIDKLASGEIKESDARSLLFVQTGDPLSLNDTIERDFIKEVDKKKEVPKPQKSVWNTVFDMVKAALPFSAIPDTVSNIVKSVQQSNVSGTNIIPVAEQEIRKKRLLERPEIAQLPETGKQFVDQYGNYAWIYPDGRIVPAAMKNAQAQQNQNKDQKAKGK